MNYTSNNIELAQDVRWYRFFRFHTRNIFISVISVLFFLFYAAPVKGQIVINELGIAPPNNTNAGQGGEFIELFNKGASSVNIGCYVIVYSGTSVLGGNPTGWTVTIPAGTNLLSGGFFLIGGGGQSSGFATWKNTGIGGS
ncbi:MAG: lamin tail domain-containing protein, partial [Ginsengibacter sp.]